MSFKTEGSDVTRFIESWFRRFYSYQASRFVEKPERVARREFGFKLFGRGIVRHLSFSSIEELLLYLKDRAPSDCYYSSAFYLNPEASMDRKGWLGAELVFDIDADHIATSCKQSHDSWRCIECRCEGVGDAPEVCPNCGGERFEESVWFCEECLEAARREVIKLVDILVSEFGFAEEVIHVYFSGHRGFHVHVTDEDAEKLDQNARREIVDYLRGVGFEYSLYFSRVDLESEMSGWGDRVLKGLYRLLSKASVEQLIGIGLSRRVAEALVEDREDILRKVLDGRLEGIVRGLGPRGLEKLVDVAVSSEAVEVDTVVTLDTHRLIRLPGSLHGKTGFLKDRVGLDRLEVYDPLSEALPFLDVNIEVDLYVENSPRFRIGEEVYGPFKDERVSLPVQPALLLLCKGRARIFKVS